MSLDLTNRSRREALPHSRIKWIGDAVREAHRADVRALVFFDELMTDARFFGPTESDYLIAHLGTLKPMQGFVRNLSQQRFRSDHAHFGCVLFLFARSNRLHGSL